MGGVCPEALRKHWPWSTLALSQQGLEQKSGALPPSPMALPLPQNISIGPSGLGWEEFFQFLNLHHIC